MTAAIQPLTYDTQSAFLPGEGISPELLREFEPALVAARRAVLAAAELWREGDSAEAEADWPDAGCIDLASRTLADYRSLRELSQLGRMLAAARRLAESVDRIVILTGGAVQLGIRALLEGCCHPYHNELSRAERGGQPRFYFAGHHLDNDALHGLVDLLVGGPPGLDAEGRWGLIVIGQEKPSPQTDMTLRVLLDALNNSCAGDRQQLGRSIAAATGRAARLRELTAALGCDAFELPAGAAGQFVLSLAGLLPAATLGLDVRRLLEGAAAMNTHFRTAPPPQNIVLNYVGTGHLMKTLRGKQERVLSTWVLGLESLVRWYERFGCASRSPNPRGAAPPLDTFAPHGRRRRTEQSQPFVTNLIVQQVRRDRLSVERLPTDAEGQGGYAAILLPDVLAAATDQVGRVCAEAGQPMADLRLPRLDESALGQLFQMLLLVTLVEEALPR